MRTGFRDERSKESRNQATLTPSHRGKKKKKKNKILKQRWSEHLPPEQLANKSSLWLQIRQTDPLRHLPVLASHHCCFVHVVRFTCRIFQSLLATLSVGKSQRCLHVRIPR